MKMTLKLKELKKDLNDSCNQLKKLQKENSQKDDVINIIKNFNKDIKISWITLD